MVPTSGIEPDFPGFQAGTLTSVLSRRIQELESNQQDKHSTARTFRCDRIERSPLTARYPGKWSPPEESNLDLRLRKPAHCPLY